MALRSPAPGFAYRPRRPETTVLYRAVQAHWETFRAETAAAADGHELPAFVRKTVDEYVRCGIAAHGLVRAHCAACGFDRFVPFSCKRRGLCPSCSARRMAETAAHLVDRVFPAGVPVRQWVLSLPFGLRVKLGYDAALCRAVLAVWARAVLGDYRQRAQRACARGRGFADGRTGAVTVIQRASATLKLDPHFHTLVPDGVWVGRDDGALEFRALPSPTAGDVARLAETVARRAMRLLARRGLVSDASEVETPEDRFVADEPMLAALAAASVQGVVATGRRRGCFVLRMGMADARPVAVARGRLCSEAAGFNVHAAVRVAASDRKGLERLCRYLARGPIAEERLREMPDGSIALRLRKPLRDGATHLAFEPMEFIEKLLPLIPAPRVHQTRFHGLLACAARQRKKVVPVPPREPDADSDGAVSDDASRRRRASWAALLSRVFCLDILSCPRCGSRMKIVAAIRDPAGLRRILEHLGLPTKPPLPHPPRSPPAVADDDRGADPDADLAASDTPAD